MGRDTKIGLLVGLAFILLFGIILAKRSAEVDLLSTPESAEVAMGDDLVQPRSASSEGDLTRAAPRMPGAETLVVHNDLAAAPTESVSTSGRWATTPALAPAGPAASLASGGGTTSFGPSGVVSASRSAGPQPGFTTGPELPGTVVRPGSGSSHTSGLSFARARLSTPPLAAPVVSAEESVTLASGGSGEGTLLAVTGGRPTASGGSRRPRRATDATVLGPATLAVAPAVAGKTYVVQEGDSFYRIATRQYGDGKHWKKIFEANRKEVPDPDLLRAGQKLVIPKLTVARTAPPSPSAPAGPRPELSTGPRAEASTPRSVPIVRTTPLLTLGPQAAAEATEPEVYKVQSGDSLTRIAERVLKDGSRAMRIYELNKDKLKDPNMLPVGVVLRLPPVAPAARIAATPASRR